VPALEPYLPKSPSGNSLRPSFPSTRLITRSDVTARASQRGSSSRSLLRCSSSAAPTTGSPTHHARRARCAEKARRVDRARADGAPQEDLSGGLRPSHRPGALGSGGGRVHNQGTEGGGQKAGKSPVDRGKRGIKRSMAVDAKGIPLGTVTAPANCHDSPLLVPTLKAASETLGSVPEEASVHLDRGYDSGRTRERLRELELGWEISGKGKPAPFWATNRWVVERTSSWHNAHKKLVWCTERVGRVIDFWVAFSDVVIIVRRLIREGWVRYRWEGRPSRRP
jgi:Transposase DDE domain